MTTDRNVKSSLSDISAGSSASSEGENEPSNEFASLTYKLSFMEWQLSLERDKHFALQGAMIRRHGLEVLPNGSRDAKIAPIEKYNGTNSGRCVIAFGGMATKLSMPVPEFTGMLTDFGPDVFFVKDFMQAWYQKGLLGVSSDVHSSVTFLSKMVADYGQTPKTVGTSAGGFAAILFGALMGSPTVVAFSPQTLLRPQIVTQFGSQDTRNEEVLSGQMLDLRAVLKSHPVADVRVYYGEDNPRDAEAVEHLRGLSGVTLLPCPTASHGTADWLRARGELGNVLQSALL